MVGRVWWLGVVVLLVMCVCTDPLLHTHGHSQASRRPPKAPEPLEGLGSRARRARGRWISNRRQTPPLKHTTGPKIVLVHAYTPYGASRTGSSTRKIPVLNRPFLLASRLKAKPSVRRRFAGITARRAASTRN